MSAIPRSSAASGDLRERRVDHLTTCVAGPHPRPTAPAEPAADNPKCICNSGASALVKRPRFNGSPSAIADLALAKNYSLRSRLRKDCFSFGGAALLAGTCDAQVLADPVGHRIDDLGVPRDRACLAVSGVPENRVPPTLAKELASVSAQMADEFGPLHSTGTASGSRTT